MVPSITVSRDTAIWECKFAFDAADLSFLSRRSAFIVAFVYCAVTQNWQASFAYGILTWFLLSIVFRSSVIVALRGTRIADLAALLQPPSRTLLAAICAAAIWYFTRNTGWDGWWYFAGLFVIDSAAALFIEVPISVPMQKELYILEELPRIFNLRDFVPLLRHMPITVSTCTHSVYRNDAGVS